ncbi:MAG: NADPH-dependent FMN reductase [Acidimicrobiia bacterium]|nr:NADPH-dependent FMN reductase [Acidimicrobiia bacterium]
MTETLTILGIPGSLRDDSYNRALLEAADRISGPDMEISIFDIDEIPHFDADVEANGDPEPVTAFKEAIRSADAILIATPEYQHGIPGVLKNALDWASRPPSDAPMNGKPTAIMGATPGDFGTARAQEDLRQVLIYNDCPMVKTPEVLVADAASKVDEDGAFVDEETLDFVKKLLDGLEDLVRNGHG